MVGMYEPVLDIYCVNYCGYVSINIQHYYVHNSEHHIMNLP
jgi:hypothetical protein